MDGVARTYFTQAPYLVWCMAISVLFTWMYNHTGGNLLAALLFQTMLNLASAIFQPLNLAPGSGQSAFLYVTVLSVILATVAALFEAVKRPVKVTQEV